MPRPEDTGPAVDAALRDLGADRRADGPSARSGMGLWDELAQAQSPERTRLLVALVALAAVATAGRTVSEKVIRRRSVSVRLRLLRRTVNGDSHQGTIHDTIKGFGGDSSR